MDKILGHEGFLKSEEDGRWSERVNVGIGQIKLERLPPLSQICHRTLDDAIQHRFGSLSVMLLLLMKLMLLLLMLMLLLLMLLLLLLMMLMLLLLMLL